MFNTMIESLDLREIDLTGRQFTWSNSLHVPTYEKLDRFSQVLSGNRNSH